MSLKFVHVAKYCFCSCLNSEILLSNYSGIGLPFDSTDIKTRGCDIKFDWYPWLPAMEVKSNRSMIE